MRLTQVKKLSSADAFLAHLDQLGVEMPFAAEVDPAGALAAPVEVRDSHAGVLRAANRFGVLPMEGWDGTTDGRPTDLVRRRWSRFAASGCGLVWGEATAVRADGRANPNQLMIAHETAGDLAQLRGVLDPSQLVGMQLTHSGRYCRPEGSPAPRTAYEHPLLDAAVGATKASVLSDDELDELAGQFVDAAALAREVGFDFVDVKHCHGYLLHELLSAYERPGRYGGDLDGRTRFLRSVVDGIRAKVPDLAVAVRLSVFDFAPYEADAAGAGAPVNRDSYPYAFGGDGTGAGIDLTEADALLDLLERLGVALVSTTAGSPYYSPHIQRPAYFPPSDGYDPPEDPLVGVARQLAVTAELKRRHPNLTLVGSGYSYLQEWLPHVAQGTVARGDVDIVGLGRMTLAYPDLAADVLAGRPLQGRQICRTFSDCTTGPRNGLISGCFPLDAFYKQHPQRRELARVKKAARRA